MRLPAIAAAVIALLAASCSAAYREPATIAAPVVATYGADRAAIFSAAVAELTASGYAPAAMDRESGLITTQPKRIQASEARAAVDLGSTMGIDYTKDNRTVTTVALTLQVADKAITITSAVTGEYLPNDAANGMHMVGASKGTIERALAERIRARLKG